MVDKADDYFDVHVPSAATVFSNMIRAKTPDYWTFIPGNMNPYRDAAGPGCCISNNVSLSMI